MSCGVGHRRSSDPTLLWLWCRPAATALIGSLAWEPPYASGVVLEMAKRQKKKDKKKLQAVFTACLPSSLSFFRSVKHMFGSLIIINDLCKVLKHRDRKFPQQEVCSFAKNHLCCYDLLWKAKKNTACSGQQLSGQTLVWVFQLQNDAHLTVPPSLSVLPAFGRSRLPPPPQSPGF